MLLGVLLTCYSSRGHQLVFRYPSNPKRRDPSRWRSSNVTSSPVAANGVDHTLRTVLDDSQQPDRDRFLGYDTHFLSDILSPKVALCDQQFQLTVDDVTFVGHPTLLHADRPGTGHRFSRMIQRKRLVAGAVVGTSPISSQPDECAALGLTVPPSPAGPPASDASSDALGVAASPVSSSSTHQLSMFNLVFALQPEGQKEVDIMYHHVISKLTAALKYEQLKRGYIRKEAELILSVRETLYSSATGRPNNVDVTERLIYESSLARCLAHVYESIRNNKIARVVVNSSIDLCLHIPDEMTKPMVLLDPGTAPRSRTQGFSSSSAYPILRPYHAILLLYDPEEILKTLPLDPSPLLVDLIQIVTPTQSLEDLQSSLDCSLSQVYRLAAHLVHWKKAKIVDALNTRNVYVVSPEAELSLLPQMVEDFESRFPQLDLPSILANLNAPRPYSAIVPDKELKTLYLEVLTYLLRHGFVAQLHMYIYLMIRQNPRLNASEIGGLGSDRVIVPEPALASEYEREWIEQIAYEQPASIAALFLKLIPYFNGKYHVEEIIYRENLTRKDLRTILSRYRDAVVSTLVSGAEAPAGTTGKRAGHHSMVDFAKGDKTAWDV
ncbi:nitrogen permease regulator of amino acid transport activity 3-domain-containing protein [Gaertneriomyces semiglobifer]|nr:nitrogen permease regulator of amino acid transport activity 3-domain-containing protein [Gaertneriomyces semiglobifer]